MTEANGTDFWLKGFELNVSHGWFTSIRATAFSQDQDHVAVAGDKGHISIINLCTFEVIGPSKLEAGVTCLYFTNKHFLIAGLDNGSIATVSMQGVPLLSKKISKKPITAIIQAKNKDLVVACDDRYLRRLQQDTFSELQRSPKMPWAASDLALSTKGDELFAAGSDHQLHLVDSEYLASFAAVHSGESRLTHNSTNDRYIAYAERSGSITVLDAGSHEQQLNLPVASNELKGLSMAANQPNLVVVDDNGTVQEWDISEPKMISALQLESEARSLAMDDCRNIIATSSSSKIYIYLRASALSEYEWHMKETERRNSIIGVISDFFRRLFKKPALPELPPAPNIPKALLRATRKIEPEIRSIESSTSKSLVECYQKLAKEAKNVDWRSVVRNVDRFERRRLEKQQLELRRLREERLKQTLDEAREKRQFRQQQLIKHEAEKERKLAEKRSKEFWEGTGKLFKAVAQFAISSSAAGTWVNSYTRKDGTKVRGYRRR